MARGVEHAQAGRGADAADALQGRVAGLGRRFHGGAGDGRSGEQKLVVVAAVEQAVDAPGFGQQGQRGSGGQLAERDFGAHATGRQDVAQVPSQAVAQVQRRMGHAGHGLAQRQPGRGAFQPGAQIGGQFVAHLLADAVARYVALGGRAGGAVGDQHPAGAVPDLCSGGRDL